MGISPIDAKENARALGKDKADADRIASIAGSLDGVYAREDTRIVKNGTRNMCRYYVLGAGAFAPWLAKVLPSTSPLGIYIAKDRTKRWEVSDRMSIAADTGKLPRSVKDVAVIRAREAEEALGYAKRAEEKLDAKFTLIHDESGARDDRAALAARDVERFDVTREITEHGTALRYTGKVTFDPRVRDIYRWSASQVCKDILSSRMANMFSSGGYVPDRLLSLLTCGHRAKGFALDEYELGIAKPESYENASYNVPFSMCDRRAFTFADSRGLLESLEEHSVILDEVLDMKRIWRYGIECAGGDEDIDLRLMYEESLRTKMSKYERMGSRYGIKPMVDSYYDGVPIDDICA